MGAVVSSEKLLSLYQTTRRHNPPPPQVNQCSSESSPLHFFHRLLFKHSCPYYLQNMYMSNLFVFPTKKTNKVLLPCERITRDPSYFTFGFNHRSIYVQIILQ